MKCRSLSFKERNNLIDKVILHVTLIEEAWHRVLLKEGIRVYGE